MGLLCSLFTPIVNVAFMELNPGARRPLFRKYSVGSFVTAILSILFNFPVAFRILSDIVSSNDNDNTGYLIYLTNP